jgi:DNA-binding transcriptional regulator YiaG
VFAPHCFFRRPRSFQALFDDDNKFYQKLGERIAQLRKEHHITQVQPAEILGISQQLVAANDEPVQANQGM